MTSLMIDKSVLDDPISETNLASTSKQAVPVAGGRSENAQAEEEKSPENKRRKTQETTRIFKTGKIKTKEKKRTKDKKSETKKNANKKSGARRVGIETAVARRGPQAAMKKASFGKRSNFGNSFGADAHANFAMMMSSNIQCGFLAVNSLIDACKKLG